MGSAAAIFGAVAAPYSRQLQNGLRDVAGIKPERRRMHNRRIKKMKVKIHKKVTIQE